MIKNRAELESKGLRNARKLVLDALEEALRVSDPRRIIKDNVRLADDMLMIKDIKIPLRYDKIYVIGGGKASGYMAEALEEILKDKIYDGLVIIPDYLEGINTNRIRLWKASHPIPNEKGVEGVKSMLKLVKDANYDDLVICLISGGGSALMPLPYDGITIEEKQKVTSMLLKAGASIDEINIVRKHISSIKGGRLVELLDTNIISLIISDVVNDRLDTIASGITAPDHTTFKDARDVLLKYGLFDAIDSIKRVIDEGARGKIKDTPKPNDPIFNRVMNIIIGNNEQACNAAKDHLASKGIDARILTTSMQGEAKEVGLLLASIANEIRRYDRPLTKPAAFIAGGECYVKVHGDGKGGRNQEAMLSALRIIEDNVVLASIGTDGIDGNSSAAGAIIDYYTKQEAERQGLDISHYLANNDSNTFFNKVKDAIYTGATGTNVNDIAIMLILKS